MKQEIKDVGIELSTRTVPAGSLAWWADVHPVTVLTGILVALQILYLLRKWWREETPTGRALKDFVEGPKP
jgi:hypothetical protein